MCSGYYCPDGQTVRDPSPYECPAGYFCVQGSSTYTLCASGYYNDEVRQSACKDCPQGFYCNSALGPILNYTLYECPEGKIQVCIDKYFANCTTIYLSNFNSAFLSYQ